MEFVLLILYLPNPSPISACPYCALGPKMFNSMEYIPTLSCPLTSEWFQPRHQEEIRRQGERACRCISPPHPLPGGNFGSGLVPLLTVYFMQSLSYNYSSYHSPVTPFPFLGPLGVEMVQHPVVSYEVCYLPLSLSSLNLVSFLSPYSIRT